MRLGNAVACKPMLYSSREKKRIFPFMGRYFVRLGIETKNSIVVLGCATMRVPISMINQEVSLLDGLSHHVVGSTFADDEHLPVADQFAGGHIHVYIG